MAINIRAKTSPILYFNSRSLSDHEQCTTTPTSSTSVPVQCPTSHMATEGTSNDRRDSSWLLVRRETDGAIVLNKSRKNVNVKVDVNCRCLTKHVDTHYTHMSKRDDARRSRTSPQNVAVQSVQQTSPMGNIFHPSSEEKQQ